MIDIRDKRVEPISRLNFTHFLSFPRKRESSIFAKFWIPDQVGNDRKPILRLVLETRDGGRHGQSLIELVVAAAVLVTGITAVALVLVDAAVSSRHAAERVAALGFAREGLEAARALRNTDFDNLIPGTYGLRPWNGRWILRGTSDIQDQFMRSVAVTRPNQDTAELVINIQWQLTPGRTSNTSLASRFTRWIRREVDNWALPVQQSSINVGGTQNGWKVAVQGNYGYGVREAGIIDFVVIDIADPANMLIVGQLILPGALRDVDIAGGFAYVASTYDAGELLVIDVSDPNNPFLAAQLNASGNANPNAVTVFGTAAYMVRDESAADELIIVDVTTPSSPLFAGSLNLATTANDIAVMNGYAYVATDHNSQELMVIDVLNPLTPAFIGSFDSPGTTNSEAIQGFGSTVLLGTIGTGDFHVLDVSNPASPMALGLYNASDAIRDIALGANNRIVFLATDADAAELQILDISSLSSPVFIGSFNVSGNNDLNGVAYHIGNDRVVAAGDHDSQEFIIVRPQ